MYLAEVEDEEEEDDENRSGTEQSESAPIHWSRNGLLGLFVFSGENAD